MPQEASRSRQAISGARSKDRDWQEGKIRRVFAENFDVYGVPQGLAAIAPRGRGYRPMHRGERLMRSMGLQGVIRGEVRSKPRSATKAAPCPWIMSTRRFQGARAERTLGPPDFTYVATWTGFVYVAFVIDAYARRIVGWRASRTAAHASFVLDALEQALHDRRPVHRDGLSCITATGAANTSPIKLHRAAWRKRVSAEPSVGSVGDSYDNALAETINGLYKAEVIHRRGPWRSFEAVEFATLEWVDWFNNRRLLEPIGNIPPAEAEERYYAMMEQPAMAA